MKIIFRINLIFLLSLTVFDSKASEKELSSIIKSKTELPQDVCDLVIKYCGWNWAIQNLNKKYLVTAPVADATTAPIKSFFKNSNKTTEQLYKELPFSSEPRACFCVRAHQLLFNECVDVNKEVDDEVEFNVNNSFYNNTKKEPVSSFWTLKKNLIPLSSCKDSLCAIPSPYANLKEKKVVADDIITLTDPWYYADDNITYSAGTRFVHNQDSDSKDSYGIFIIDLKNKNKIIKKSIPCNMAYLNDDISFDKKMAKFISILNKWAEIKSGKIPYVLGGCSYTSTCDPKKYSLVTSKEYSTIQYWVRPTEVDTQTGFDCSGLALRAAQIAGLCYFCKNTITITHCLKQVLSNEKLQDGDLIWIPGHVMIISSIKNNELIHSWGYANGSASVVKTELAKVFENVNTYDQLEKKYLNTGLMNKSLQRSQLIA